jgi:hypothetical protein
VFYQFGERSICCSIKSLHFSVVFIKPVFNESGYRYFLKSILVTVSEPRFLSARSVYQRSVYQRFVSALFMGKNCDANRCSPASKR